MSDARQDFIDSMPTHADAELLDMHARLAVQRANGPLADAETNLDQLLIVRGELKRRLTR